MKHQRGFSLIELVMVVVVIGVLAAAALPAFVDIRKDARVASLATLAAALQTTANDVHAACALKPNCDYANATQNIIISGRWAALNYGWPDAGDTLGASEIDVFVDYSGFTPSLPHSSRTLFSLDGSTDPATCSVTYTDVYTAGVVAGQLGPTISITSTGC